MNIYVIFENPVKPSVINTSFRVYRGGTYGINGNTVSSDRNIAGTTNASGIIGTRFTLYLK